MKTELEERTKKFAVQVVKTVAAFPKNSEGQIVGRQLLRAGTSIGANYREANRAESKNDFIHKVGIAEKEVQKRFTGWKSAVIPALARKNKSLNC